jgi:hypothetical protein
MTRPNERKWPEEMSRLLKLKFSREKQEVLNVLRAGSARDGFWIFSLSLIQKLGRAYRY